GALDYLRIVWALGFGYFIFNETLDFSEMLGIVLICTSGLLSLKTSTKKKY
ncbi:MAG: EamA/RhaT family transporter, partial [Alphaproteobacteria bacterium]|nr:EamA/RhaT family transporter [Alphaproteobacteria bacterium]